MVTRLDPEQLERNERGLSACRSIVAQVLARRAAPEPAKPLSPSDALHQRALERAIAEKRTRRSA